MSLRYTLPRKAGVALRTVLGSFFLFEFIEKYYLSKLAIIKSTPPIIIVGAPRTGSTMLYQYLTSVGEFAYISNLASIFFRSPVFITRLFKDKYSVNDEITNEYGLINGLFSPSESAKVFEQWFEKEADSTNKIEHVRNSIFALSQLLDGPFIGKNMNNSIRIYNIKKIFPDALFIYLKRDPLYTAQSILIARKRIKKSYYKWWSTKPYNYQEVKDLPPWEQAFHQVRGIEDYLEKALSGDTNTIRVNYENFCKNPSHLLDYIHSWYIKHGISIRLNQNNHANFSIKISQKKKLNDREWALLQNAFKKVYYL